MGCDDNVSKGRCECTRNVRRHEVNVMTAFQKQRSVRHQNVAKRRSEECGDNVGRAEAKRKNNGIKEVTHTFAYQALLPSSSLPLLPWWLGRRGL